MFRYRGIQFAMLWFSQQVFQWREEEVGRGRKRVGRERRGRRDGVGVDTLDGRVVDHAWASPDGWPTGTRAGAGR